MDGAISVKVRGVYIVESEGGSPAPVVFLEDEKTQIMPIFVGLSEAVSIHHALSGEISPRPMTHDLFMSMLENLNAKITKVFIDDMDSGVYYARLVVNNGHGESELDARPSDCLALALRAKAPILIQDKIMAEAKIERSEMENLKSIEDYLI